MKAHPRPIEIEVIGESERAHCLLHPARLQLLIELEEPASAVALARRLGLPRQRVNYHLRELEAQRLIEAVDERRRGSVVERLWQRTGHSYAISPAVLGALESDPRSVQDRFSSADQVALAARAVSELGRLEAGARAAGQRLPSIALETELRFATPAARAAFAEELTAAVASLVERYHDATAEGGREFRFYLGGYPRPKPELP